ncbi:hypothetical protein [Rummeliibacillus pycnus]|uniref:hypothetical protein n=1 Tax=Rummeliibacillus pycnus TaxID=101070 RepID=UPI000C9A3560|nr:hypothetical protein [Rummeliibacillus pycnus]
MNTYISALKAIKEHFRSESAYRYTLARAFVLNFSNTNKYIKRSEILAKTNQALRKEGLKPVSYNFVKRVLEPTK